MITGEMVKNAMIENDIISVDHHTCGICNYMTAYIRNGEKLFFDAGCNCGVGRNVDERSWDSAANWINMQSKVEVKDKLINAFGLAITDAK